MSSKEEKREIGREAREAPPPEEPEPETPGQKKTPEREKQK